MPSVAATEVSLKPSAFQSEVTIDARLIVGPCIGCAFAHSCRYASDDALSLPLVSALETKLMTSRAAARAASIAIGCAGPNVLCPDPVVK